MIKSLLGSLVALTGFLLGVRLMSDALRSSGQARLQAVVGQLTDRPLPAFLLSMFVTACIQSSSATTVVMVALVDAGVLSLLQTLPLIAGANVGTTITAQIASLELSRLIIPAWSVGLSLCCSRKTRTIGRVAVGLGLLFFGLHWLSLCLQPLLLLPVMRQLLLRCAGSTGFSLLVGTLVTALVQSSSMVTGVVIALSHSQLLNLPAALGLVIGSNLGTCATAMIAAIGSGRAGRRVAYVHLLFNLSGAAVSMLFLPGFVRLVAETAPDLPRQIANGHTLFNLQTAVLWLIPLIAWRRLSRRGPRFKRR